MFSAFLKDSKYSKGRNKNSGALQNNTESRDAICKLFTC